MTTLDLIGSSPKFRAVLTDLDRIAPVDSAVLIQGETGTGKEVDWTGRPIGLDCQELR
jgi:transcriptional regulator with PAS, ATPase and Fis domain